MEIEYFSEIEEEFVQRVHAMVWCNAATVDRRGSAGARILHPIWEGCTGWVVTHRYSHKSKHLAHNPHVSLAYITQIHEPVYVDCVARCVEDIDQKLRVWELFKSTPPPLGFDPTPDFVSADHENFGLLQLTPWRIALVNFPAESHHAGQRVWRESDEN